MKGVITLNKFTCQNEKCIKLHNEDDEDIRLRLIVEDGTRTEYIMNENGTLELYDSEGTGQEIRIICDICGHEYELDEPYGYYEIKESYSLFFGKEELEEVRLLKKGEYA